MVVDGKAVAAAIYDDIKKSLARMDGAPTLAIISCDPQGPSQKYVALKERQAAKIGITVVRKELASIATTEAILAAVSEAHATSTAIIVQLPLPSHINTDAVLAAIAPTHDVDALSYDGTDEEVLPPVVGAIIAIAQAYDFSFLGRHIVVVGAGRLVGAPFLKYAQARALGTTLVDETTENPETILQSADVIISGVGKPGLVARQSVKNGVAIFDAGTSEVGGILEGDVEPSVAGKALIFTPVPGGIGPVTMAVLFQNCVLLKKRADKNMI